jgi:hypothetical protein
MKSLIKAVYTATAIGLGIWFVAVPARAAFNTTANVVAALGAFVAGWSPDLGNVGSVSAYHNVGGGTPNALNILSGIEANTAAPIGNIGVGSSSVASSQFQCGSGTGSSVALAARTGPVGTGRITVKITNTGTVAVNIGTAGVSGSTGAYLAGVAGQTIDIPTAAAIYCFAASNETISFLESY